MVDKNTQEFILLLRQNLPEAVCYKVKKEEGVFWLDYKLNFKIPTWGLDIEKLKIELASLGNWQGEYLEIFFLKTKLSMQVWSKISWEEEYVNIYLPFELALNDKTSSEEIKELVEIVNKEAKNLKANLEQKIKNSQKLSC